MNASAAIASVALAADDESEWPEAARNRPAPVQAAASETSGVCMQPNRSPELYPSSYSSSSSSYLQRRPMMMSVFNHMAAVFWQPPRNLRQPATSDGQPPAERYASRADNREQVELILFALHFAQLNSVLAATRNQWSVSRTVVAYGRSSNAAMALSAWSWLANKWLLFHFKRSLSGLPFFNLVLGRKVKAEQCANGAQESGGALVSRANARSVSSLLIDFMAKKSPTYEPLNE